MIIQVVEHLILIAVTYSNLHIETDDLGWVFHRNLAWC